MPGIFGVLLQPFVTALDIRPLEEAQNMFFQLAGAFARNDFKLMRMLFGFREKTFELLFYFVAFVVYIMKVELEFCHGAVPFLSVLYVNFLRIEVKADRKENVTFVKWRDKSMFL